MFNHCVLVVKIFYTLIFKNVPHLTNKGSDFCMWYVVFPYSIDSDNCELYLSYSLNSTIFFIYQDYDDLVHFERFYYK